MNEKGTLVTSNQRFLSQPTGWHVWIASAVTAALVASKRKSSYVLTGTNLGSSFIQNGTKYFDRHSSSKWHGISGNYWEQLFWDIGLPVFSPISGMSELLNLDISYKKLDKTEVVYCNKKDGGNCGKCAKCFRRECVEDFLGVSNVDYEKFRNADVIKMLDKRPTYFGHLYASMLNDGWLPPKWILDRLSHLPSDVSFPLKYNVESLDFVPENLRDEISKRILSNFEPMSEKELSSMKAWDQVNISDA